MRDMRDNFLRALAAHTGHNVVCVPCHDGMCDGNMPVCAMPDVCACEDCADCDECLD